MADYNFSADHAENNMACDVSITFVDELRDFDVEKSGKNRRRRTKWSWFAAIAEESGSDVDRAVMGTKFRNNPRSMARTKKRLKINIMGHRDSLSYLILSCAHSILPKYKVVSYAGVYRLKNRARYFDMALTDQEN